MSRERRELLKLMFRTSYRSLKKIVKHSIYKYPRYLTVVQLNFTRGKRERDNFTKLTFCFHIVSSHKMKMLIKNNLDNVTKHYKISLSITEHRFPRTICKETQIRMMCRICPNCVLHNGLLRNPDDFRNRKTNHINSSLVLNAEYSDDEIDSQFFSQIYFCDASKFSYNKYSMSHKCNDNDEYEYVNSDDDVNDYGDNYFDDVVSDDDDEWRWSNDDINDSDIS